MTKPLYLSAAASLLNAWRGVLHGMETKGILISEAHQFPAAKMKNGNNKWFLACKAGTSDNLDPCLIAIWGKCIYWTFSRL